MTTIKNLMGAGNSALAAQASMGFLSNGLTAAGTNQATALALPSDWGVFTTVALNTGTILPTSTSCDWLTVTNHGANPLSVYPPVGGTIATGAANAAFSVPVGKTAYFQAITGINFTASVSA